MVVDGTGTPTASSSNLKKPSCLYMESNGDLIICDHENNRIQRWVPLATNGTTILGNSSGGPGTGASTFDHTQGFNVDIDGNRYVLDHKNNRVQQFPPNSTTGVTVAGVLGGTSTANNHIKYPADLIIDDNMTMYIADKDQKRVMEWPVGASSGVAVIDGNGVASGNIDKPVSLLFVPGSSNKLYVSDESKKQVQLWTFNSTSPDLIFGGLSSPKQIAFDSYGNLYVADKGNQNIVRFCLNPVANTTGTQVIGSTGLNEPVALAFDSAENMYVLDANLEKVFKYNKI